MPRVVLLSLGLLILVGCFSGNRLPGPGDTVAPRIVQPINWLAGEMGEIYVDLSAKNEGGNVRQLGFAASPVENPQAWSFTTPREPSSPRRTSSCLNDAEGACTTTWFRLSATRKKLI